MPLRPTKRHPPLFEAEREAWSLLPAQGLLAAFDEVGRGCVAGPVVAGCTLWKRGTPTPAQKRLLPLIDDSKALSAPQRVRIAQEFDVPFATLFEPPPQERSLLTAEHLVAPLRAPLRFEELVSQPSTGASASFVCVGAALGLAEAWEIDSSDIWTCVQLAMARAFAHATFAFPEIPAAHEVLFVVDGKCGIKVAPEHAGARQLTCVKGDSRFVALGLSSILAKVARDALMVEAARTHPEYGFEKHKGYGTAAHYEALRRHAPISLHRRTFLRSLALP